MKKITVAEKTDNAANLDTLFYRELIAWIIANIPDKKKLFMKKKSLIKEVYGNQASSKRIPTDIEVYMNSSVNDAPHIKDILLTKPARTMSGVAVVATMSAPFSCPHGTCTYCPGGPNSKQGNVPKSYVGNEPSTMRGIRNDFDPYRIIFNRLEQYIVLGQNPDKVDQIIMGGTFPSFPEKYQKRYIYYSFKAYNDFSRLFFRNGKLDFECFKTFFELPGKVNDEERIERIKNKILQEKDRNDLTTIEEEQKINETSAIRCIGLTIETKPDWATKSHALKLLDFGATRIELGVQTVYDEVLKAVNRGHDMNDTRSSIADLKDLGFKINFHMMPGLPDKDGKRISKEKDITSLKQIFADETLKPDMLKIYPCMVMPGTPLEKQYDSGLFVPLNAKDAIEIIVEAKKYVPEYCRIMRIQRDIPTYSITAGVERTNLRQDVDKACREQKIKCRCIRCREIKNKILNVKPEIIVRQYQASAGKEFFISMESNDILLGFVRLRFPPRSIHPAISHDSAIIRELHVYGSAVAIGDLDTHKTQHKGIGRELMEYAEEIALKNGKNKIIVISGVGAREYYRKIGYTKEGPYMTKYINHLNNK